MSVHVSIKAGERAAIEEEHVDPLVGRLLAQFIVGDVLVSRPLWR